MLAATLVRATARRPTITCSSSSRGSGATQARPIRRGPTATPAPGLGAPLPHLHRDLAHPCHICTGTGLTLPPHLHRDWARRCHICVGTGLTPCHICVGTGLTPDPMCAGTGLTPAHICAGTGLTPATSAPGLGLPLPHLRRDWGTCLDRALNSCCSFAVFCTSLSYASSVRADGCNIAQTTCDCDATNRTTRNVNH